MNKRARFLRLLILGFLIIATLGHNSHPAKGIIWIEGQITSDTTWSSVNTYRVINNTYVAPAVTLTILPGVHVQFAEGLSLVVEGSLNATGTDIDPIVFTSNRSSPSAGAWNTVHFKGASNCSFVLDHVRVEYNVNGVTIESQRPATISRSEIFNCSESGIMIKGISKVVIEENVIKYTKKGIDTDYAAHAGIIIARNTVCSNAQNGIDLYTGPYSSIYNVTFSCNNISSNGGNGIHFHTYGGPVYNVALSYNTVSSNTQNGIYLQTFYDFSDCRIYNVNFLFNNISSNGGHGIYLSSDRGSPVYNVAFSSNTISSNGGSGIQIYMRRYNSPIYNVTFSSNNISSNAGNGIELFAHAYPCPFHRIIFISNTVSSNGGNGIRLQTRWYSAPIYDVTFSSNNVSSNGGDGIQIYTRDSPIYDVIFISNTVSSNGGNGIYLSGDLFQFPSPPMALVYNVALSYNTVSLNTQNGISLCGSHESSVTFDITALGNRVSANNQKGLHVRGIKSNITENSIGYNQYGVFYEDTTGNYAKWNDIYSNPCGMNVTSGATVTAEHNYWGDSSGPFHPSLNPEGKGNPVDGNGVDVDFIPFLTSPNGEINERPIAAMSVDKDTPNINEAVTFDATNSTDDGRIDYYFFDFGDGTDSGWTTLPVVTHQYLEEGTYNATLVVKDDFGVTSFDGILIYVTIDVIPEYPNLALLSFFMLAALLAVALYAHGRSLSKPFL